MTAETQIREVLARKKKMCIRGYWLAVFFLGFASTLLWLESGPPKGFWGIGVAVITFFAFGWYIFDSSFRGVQPSYGAKVGMVALIGVALPVYLIKVRGWKRGAVAVSKGIGVFLLGIVASVVGSVTGAVVLYAYSVI